MPFQTVWDAQRELSKYGDRTPARRRLRHEDAERTLEHTPSTTSRVDGRFRKTTAPRWRPPPIEMGVGCSLSETQIAGFEVRHSEELAQSTLNPVVYLGKFRLAALAIWAVYNRTRVAAPHCDPITIKRLAGRNSLKIAP